MAVAAAVAAPGAQQEAAGPAGAPQQTGDFDSSRYTLHSQGAEAVSAGGGGGGRWPSPQRGAITLGVRRCSILRLLAAPPYGL